MKSIVYLLSISFLILVARCSPTDSSSYTANDQEEVTEENTTWDKKQYFDHLQAVSLDSLGQVITKADSVVAYNWNDRDGNPANVYHHIVDFYGQFSDRINQVITLNAGQQSTLSSILTDSSNFEGSNSSCFIPHIAFVYYRQGKIIGQSNVCFFCAGVKSVPKSTTALSAAGVRVLRDFCGAVGLELLAAEDLDG